MLEESLKTPRYWRLAEHLRDLVTQGGLRPGDRVPSLAELQAQFELSRSTVEKAFTLLEQEGLIVRRQGHGTFVASPQRREASGLIGIVSWGIFGPQAPAHLYPYSESLLTGIGSVLHQAEKRIVLLGCDSAAGWDKVDGVLICMPDAAEAALRLVPAAVPAVSLFIAANGASSVSIDDVDGGRQAVKHLLSLGHRRIACLMEPEPPLARARLTGYRAGFHEAGIEPDAVWMRQPSHPLDRKLGFRDWGRENIRHWLDSGWLETGCTALLAQNGSAAIGALEAFDEAHISVPEQVSIICFDSSAICCCVSPRITAIEVPLQQIAARAAELLLDQIGQSAPGTQEIVLPTRIQVRESTAPPPADSHQSRGVAARRTPILSRAPPY